MAAALDTMFASGRGHIVNIVSLARLSAVPGEAAYAGTQHAVMGLSLSTMLDVRIAGLKEVTISCIARVVDRPRPLTPVPACLISAGPVWSSPRTGSRCRVR